MARKKDAAWAEGARIIPSAEAPIMTGLSAIPTSDERLAAVERMLEQSR